MSRKMMSSMVSAMANTQLPAFQKENLISRLSPREMDVLRELAVGATNDEIAQRLFLSSNTVKHHIHNIFDKLSVETRQAAAALARQLGLTNGNTQFQARNEQMIH